MSKRTKPLNWVLGLLASIGLTAYGASDVTQPGDPLIASSPNNPGSEGVANAIDGQPTKYLNFDAGAADGNQPTGFIVSPSVGITQVTGIALQSANDAPERDPAVITLEGSNDADVSDFNSGNWELIAEVTVPSWVDTFPDDHRFQTQTFNFDNFNPYRHYRWTVVSVQNIPVAANSMQIAEVELLGRVVPGDVTQPGDALIASSPNNPGSEGVANAIDGQPTKYLNFDAGAADGNQPTGFIVTPSIGDTVVSGIALQSANDAPERDPAVITLEGSNDAEVTDFNSGNWELIAEVTVPSWVDTFPDDHRFQTQTFLFGNVTPYAHYRWTVVSVQNIPVAANSMQIAEVELLGTGAPKDVTQPGDALIASSPNNPGSEGVANAIDGQPTKYLNFDAGAADGNQPTGFVVTPSIGATTVTGLSMQSANDAPERDPAVVTLEGSNDAEVTDFNSGNWELIAELTVPSWVDTFPDDHRFQTQSFYFENSNAYLHYRWTVVSVQNIPVAANSMQIAEVEFLAAGDSVDCEKANFVLQPVNTPVLSGSSATFFAEVNGPWPVQWHRNGAPIPGATSLSYTTDPVTSANEADVYAVEIVGCSMSNEVVASVFDPAAQPVSIGINFDGGGANGAPTATLAEDIAGNPFQQAYWNVATEASSASVLNNLVNSRNQTTAVTVDFTSSGEWGAGTGNESPTRRLLNGLIHAQAGAPGTIEFGDVPAGNHTLVAYTVGIPLQFQDQDYTVIGASESSIYTLQMNSDQYNPVKQFFRGTSTDPNNRTLANYVVFENVQPDADGNITLEWSTTTEGFDRGVAINAVQLILNAPTLPEPPRIVESPQPRVVQETSYVALNAIATGNDLEFQWLKNGVAMSNGGNIRGANSDTLEISSFGEEDIGFYSIAVFNPGGSLISASAKVDIIGSDATINDGLIAHFAMDGNLTNDGSDGINGTAFDAFGTELTSPTFNAGQVGQALTLDGFSYVFVEDYSDIDEEVTVSMWVNIDPAVLNGFDVPTFIRNVSGEIGVASPLEQFEMGLQFNANDQLMRLSAAIAAGPNIVRATDPIEFPLGEWQHVAFTADGGQVRLYRNGNLVAASGYLDDINPANRNWLSIGAKLTEDDFGIFPDISLPDFFIGEMDDVAIWLNAWSGADIAAMHAAGVAGSSATSINITIPPIEDDPGGSVDENIATLEIPAGAGTGLDGRYWKLPVGSIVNIQDMGGPNDIGLKTIKGGKPHATFTATNIDYSGDDLTPLVDWLRDDAASIVGNPNNLDDGLLSFTGWIAISEAGTVNFNTPSDDGTVVWIGDQLVVNNDGSHGAPGDNANGSFDFAAPGLYPIEIAWFNGDWTDDAGAHGGASIQFISDGGAGLGNAGGIVPPEKLYGSADTGVSLVGASSINVDAAGNGDGLTGRYWQLPVGSILNLKDLGGESDIGLKTMQTMPPAGHFTATGLEYTGDDLTPIVDWLNSGGNNDGASFSGYEGNLDDGLISFDGYIYLEKGETAFNSSSDDGSIVWIGGTKVVDNDGSHGSPGDNAAGSAFIPVDGLYPISIAWFNGDWTDDAGAHGGANITFTSNGEPVTRLYQADTAFELTATDIGIEGDPVVPGSSDIIQDTAFAYDVDVTSGGSDIWGADDSGHYVYTEWTGDFDASVEVTRLDVVNQWSKAAIDVRESLDTGSRKLHVNVDSAAETPADGSSTGANLYEVGARVETGGDTSAWDAFGGEPIMDAADTTLPKWMRMTRQGNLFTAYRSDDGVVWRKLSSIDLEMPAMAIVALGTTSHNNDGADFVTNAEYRNFHIFSPVRPPALPPMGAMLMISYDGTSVTVEWTSGMLQSAPAANGPWTDVTATSPHTEAATDAAKFYRAVE